MKLSSSESDRPGGTKWHVPAILEGMLDSREVRCMSSRTSSSRLSFVIDMFRLEVVQSSSQDERGKLVRKVIQ